MQTASLAYEKNNIHAINSDNVHWSIYMYIYVLHILENCTISEIRIILILKYKVFNGIFSETPFPNREIKRDFSKIMQRR